MNPQDLFLPSTSQQPLAGTAPASQVNGFSNGNGKGNGVNGVGVAAAASGSGSGPMETDEQVAQEIPKTQKELEQEKKDLELAELLDMMDEWKPIIPDEVTDYYLQRAGFDTSDVRVKRLLALATQRFISSISADAFQYARTRTAAGPGGRSNASGSSRAKDRTRTVLTMEDLSAALKEYGVGSDRAQYYL